MLKTLKSLHSVHVLDPNPEIFFLKNPTEAFWLDEIPEFEPWNPHAAVTRTKTFFFIHGSGYGSKEEIFEDLLKPFEMGAQIFREKGRVPVRCGFLSWNSLFAAGEIGKFNTLQNLMKNPLLLLLSLPSWKHHLAEIERRARLVAEQMAPQIRSFVEPHAKEDIVFVCHSIGSYLFAHLLKRLLAHADGLEHPPQCWHLQPALAARDFHHDGEFHGLTQFYHDKSGHFSVWHSQWDIVLNTFYRLAKGVRAIGQRCPLSLGAKKIITKDVSALALEAHGKTAVQLLGEGFFHRIGTLLHTEARILLQP